MAVTVHYIARNVDTGFLVQRSQLLAFRFIPGTHDGPSLAAELLKIIDEFKFAHRINASSNNTLMVALEGALTFRGIEFHHDGNRVRFVFFFFVRLL